MNDWLHNLPVLWMALVIFGFTYLVSGMIYATVIVLAAGKRARSFKAVSPGMLPPLGIMFGLFVAFTAAQVWSDNDRASATVNREANLVWVDAEFLRVREVGEWMELPLWLVDPEWTGMLDTDVSKAVAAGLTFRPLEETISGTLAEAALTDEAGMKPEREAELLAEWAKLASHA